MLGLVFKVGGRWRIRSFFEFLLFFLRFWVWFVCFFGAVGGGGECGEERFEIVFFVGSGLGD